MRRPLAIWAAANAMAALAAIIGIAGGGAIPKTFASAEGALFPRIIRQRHGGGSAKDRDCRGNRMRSDHAGISL